MFWWHCHIGCAGDGMHSGDVRRDQETRLLYCASHSWKDTPKELCEKLLDNVGVLLKWKVTHWCSNSPPFQPNIEARLLFKPAKLYQQIWDRGPTGNSGPSNANRKAVNLIFYSALLSVSFGIWKMFLKLCPFQALLCLEALFLGKNQCMGHLGQGMLLQE